VRGAGARPPGSSRCRSAPDTARLLGANQGRPGRFDYCAHGRIRAVAVRACGPWAIAGVQLAGKPDATAISTPGGSRPGALKLAYVAPHGLWEGGYRAPIWSNTLRGPPAATDPSERAASSACSIWMANGIQNTDACRDGRPVRALCSTTDKTGLERGSKQPAKRRGDFDGFPRLWQIQRSTGHSSPTISNEPRWVCKPSSPCVALGSVDYCLTWAMAVGAPCRVAMGGRIRFPDAPTSSIAGASCFDPKRFAAAGRCGRRDGLSDLPVYAS
jgi:hypothetical protein